jgi:hypothetical protein
MYHSKCRLLYFHVMSTNKHFFFRKPQNCMFPLIFLCTTKLYSSLHLLSSSRFFFFFFDLWLSFLMYGIYLTNYYLLGRWQEYLNLRCEARACCRATSTLAPTRNNESYNSQTNCDSSSSSSSQKPIERPPTLLSGSLSSQSLTGLAGSASSSSASSSPISNLPFSKILNSPDPWKGVSCVSGGSVEEHITALAPESRKALIRLGLGPYVPVQIMILSLQAPTYN